MTAGAARVRPAGLRAVRELLGMVAFPHSLFALPFALTGLLAAASGLPDARTTLLALSCLVAARTAAMTWNRIADRRFDAVNPRTSARALPAGRVSVGSAWALLALSAGAFVAAAAAINRACLLLSPVALAVVLGYSLTKRFTWATHFVLGASLAIAPIGGWVAVRGSLSAEPLLLGLAVACWTAGFDLIYACLDAAFDRSAGLYSLPARFGIPAALATSRALHAATVIALGFFGWASGLGGWFHAAVVVAAGILAWAQSLVRPDDLSRVGLAFFQSNVAVGIVVLAGLLLDPALD